MTNMQFGLTLTVVGAGLTLLSLALIAVVIKVMVALSPANHKASSD